MSKSEKSARDPLPGTLQHWREALPEERMAHLVKDTTRGFSRSLQARLREHAVQYGHWTFLRILWQTDGLTQRQLSEQAGVAEPTTFSALKTMEALGYVTRQKLPDNRKQVRIFLTPKGASLRALLVPAAVEVNRIALSGISVEDIAATRRTLLAMMENLAGDPFFANRANAESLNGESGLGIGDDAASDAP
ncbi:MarR family winged helix-turn-helix transcriptional regulator [Paraburkholderia fungorum]|jgi:MarR family transcriptional regulator, organic hydroperoxide resistance regulator|uniref:MarR family winged helix-turn-helix transcriptional regulator n=1 Tax=Paraburkholderia fungorum TaxID=134537 RepID=UPI0038BC4A29